MKRALYVGVGIFALAAQSASAADLPRAPIVKAPPVAAPIFNWTGFYIGGQVGYQWNKDDFSDPAFGPPPISGSFDADGFIGGAHAGYNAQFGMLVVGVEGDIEWANASGSGTAFDGLGTVVTGHAELAWQGSVRGRLGVAADRTLFYLTAGVAWGNFDFGYTFEGVTDSFSETMTGWTVGGGLEHAFAPNWSARIEYRFTDYGSASGTIINCCAGPPNGQRHELESHAIRAGLSYKFATGKTPVPVTASY